MLSKILQSYNLYATNNTNNLQMSVFSIVAEKRKTISNFARRGWLTIPEICFFSKENCRVTVPGVS